MVGTVGRESGEVRLRVVKHADKVNLLQHVHSYTDSKATLYSDEWRSYEQVERLHHTVKHGSKEWARDDDGDGVREVHVNTIEGLWTTLRNFLRPFRGGSYVEWFLPAVEGEPFVTQGASYANRTTPHSKPSLRQL